MPAETVKEVKRILHLDVQYEKAIQRLGEYKAKIEDINKQMKELKKQMSSGRMAPADLKSAQTHYAALDAQIRVLKKDEQELMKTTQNTIKVHREYDNSLRSLRAQLSSLTLAFDKLSAAERNAAKGQELQKNINDVTAKLKAAEMATQRFYRNVGNYQDALNGLDKIKSGFSTLGGVITGMLGGLGLQTLSNNIISVARDFEDSIARVRAVSNPMMTEFMDLRDKALELGATTRYTSGEVARGMEELARKGLTAKQTLDSIMPTLQLAQANMVSVADAAQISSSTMRAFGMQTEDLVKINDVLSSTCAHSASTLGLMSEAMKTAGPVAKTANVSLEETAALIGSLANVGMTGSDAGTGIKQIILALSSAATTKKGAKVLEHYNIQLDETRIKEEGLLKILKEMKEKGLGESLTDLQKLTGKYASPRIANLINNIDEAIALNETLQNSLGENERMFEQSLSPLSNSIYQMQSAWQNFMTNMEHSSDSVFVKVLDGITEIIRFINQFPGLIMGVIGVIASVKTFTPLVQFFQRTYQAGVEQAKIAANEEMMVNEEKINELYKQEKKLAANRLRIKGEITSAEENLEHASAQEIKRVKQVKAQEELTLRQLTAEKETEIEKIKSETVIKIQQQEIARQQQLLVQNEEKKAALLELGVKREEALAKARSNTQLQLQQAEARRVQMQLQQTELRSRGGNLAQQKLAQLRKQIAEQEKAIAQIEKAGNAERGRINAQYRAEQLRLEQELASNRLAIWNDYIQKRNQIESEAATKQGEIISNFNTKANEATQERVRVEKEAAQKRIEIEEDVARKKAQLEREKVEANKAANDKIVLQDRQAAQQTMSATQVMSRSVKGAIAGVKGVLGSVVSMLKFQIWIAAITTIVELTTKIVSNARAVDNNIKDLNNKIAEINAGTSETVRKIEQIKNRFKELQGITDKTSKEQEEYNRLLDTARRYVNDRDMQEWNIVEALDNQIKQIKERNRLEAIRQSMSEDSGNILRNSIKFGSEGVSIQSPEDIVSLIWKLSKATRTELMKQAAFTFQRNFIAGFKDDTNLRGFPKNKVYGNWAVESNVKEAKDFFDLLATQAGFSLDGIASYFGVGSVQDIENAVIQYIRKTGMINKKDYYGEDGADIQPTYSGSYNAVDWSTNKGRKGRDFDPLQYLQNLLNKYSDTFNILVAETTMDVIEKQETEINNALIELKGDVYKIIGGEVDGKKYDPVPQWKRAAAKYPKLAAQVTDMMSKAMEQAQVRADMRLDQLLYQRNERQYKIDKEGWDARIALVKEKMSEWVLITRQNVLSETEKTLEQTEELYNLETDAFVASHNKALEELEKSLVTSGLVKDKNGNELKTRNQILKAYEEYKKTREEIEAQGDNYNDGKSRKAQYSKEDYLKELNQDNEALAHYYDQKSLIQARYEQESRNRASKHQREMAEITYNGLKKQNDLIIQGMRNQLAELQVGYDAATNLNRSYHTRSKIGTAAYWDELVGLVGERQAQEFQLQYEMAKKKYDFIVQQGQLETETEEDYDKRRIEAKKEVVDIETKINAQIFSNQQAVIQSLDSLVGSYGQLATAMIDDEKEKAEAMKVFTVMQVFLKMALSMANIVELASHKGAFGIPEAIAGIAEVMTLFGTIISTMKQADAKGYARGGKVTGPGTGTSDSISTNLSNGEFVMTAKATKLFEPLLVAMNGIGAGVALPRNNYVQTQQSADLSDAFITAAEKIQPVVDVREVTRAQNRVKTIQNLGSYKL